MEIPDPKIQSIPLHILTALDNNFTLTVLPSSLQRLLVYPHSQLMSLLPTSWKKTEAIQREPPKTPSYQPMCSPPGICKMQTLPLHLSP